MVTAQRKHTASEIVLLAADELTTAGNLEFSEWDLTVAAWSLDRFRFGLRGYAESYPDHKRVMMEIMGQKASSPIQQKFFEKVRPNYYRMTPLGRTAAARVRGGGPKPTGKPATAKDPYEMVAAYVGRPEFRRWQDNPEEPREWDGAAAFLGIGPQDPVDPAGRAEEIRHAIRAALDWCTVQETAFLTRGSGQGGPPVHVRDLADVLDFLQALTYRFPDHLEPGERQEKHTKRFD